MAKVTSKLQVTIPKAVAERYGIRPGDEINWEPAGDVIRVFRPAKCSPGDVNTRLEIFDQATARLRSRHSRQRRLARPSDRGWKREDLYIRGGTH